MLKGLKLPSRANTPLRTAYRPKLDVYPVLDPTEAVYYQSLIGVLCWMVELGRVDICLEVSIMSSWLAMPCKGHLEQLYHIFAHLKVNHNSKMVFDPSDPVIDESAFQRGDWSTAEFGQLGKEELSGRMPAP